MKQGAVKICLLALALYSGTPSFAQKDTLRVMAYNVLYYGNGCQGPNGYYHQYLKTIVTYANPDLLSMDKMASIPVSDEDKYGTAPKGFADSILQYALNAAFPGRYAYCTITNAARSASGAALFYDQRKLGYLGITCSYVNITDFNTYKLYYKDPNLARTHDTTFLYVLPTHDRSGDENENVRGVQIGEEMKGIKAHFTHLPNFINLGDYNSRNSDEPVYQTLVANKDTGFRFSDPPFYPDRKLSYPANWDHNTDFAAYFTTSTRKSADVPNSCGTGGGGKNWYDHIFISKWIVNNTNYIRYIPNSYHTIGNDGQRYKVAINDKNAHENTAAPAEVIEALYRMSNKYPVMLSLEVTQNTSGASPADPEIANPVVFVKEEATMTVETDGTIVIHFPDDVIGQDVKIKCTDKAGNTIFKNASKVKEKDMRLSIKADAGVYTLNITGHHNLILESTFTKK